MALDFVKHNPLSRGILEYVLRRRCHSTKAFVFVASPGRSGSKTLSDMLTGIPGIAAFHEPTPNLIFEPACGPDQAAYLRSMFFEKKIFYVLRAAAGHSHYVETNHLFIKTFAEPAIEYFGDRTQIVHLRRDAISVALSFYKLGEIPGVEEVARRYMLDPAGSGNLVDPTLLLQAGSGFEHPFYRCLWYWHEIEARIARAKAQYPNVRWHFLETDQLNDAGAVRDLCRALTIDSHVDEIVRRAGLRSNLRTEKKDVAAPQMDPLSREQAAQMHARLIEALGLDVDPCR